MTASLHNQGILGIVLILAGLVIILAGMRQASSLIAPLLLGLFFAILFGMLMRWLEAKGVPHWLALAVAAVLFLAVEAGFFLLIAATFVQLAAQLPANEAAIEGALSSILTPLGIDVPSLSDGISRLVGFSLSAVSGIVSSLTSVALITLSALFLLAEANAFTAKVRAILVERPAMLEHLSFLAEKIVGYIVFRTEVNLVTGVSIGLVIAAVGLEYAVFWGFIAFALSFIPYIGFALAVIPPVLIAWSTLGLSSAVIIFIGAVILDFVAENILFPEVAGKGLHVSPAVVFISLVCWGYVLGSIGAILAVPLTLALMMVLQFFDETRWIGVLLNPAVFSGPESGPSESGCPEPPPRSELRGERTNGTGTSRPLFPYPSNALRRHPRNSSQCWRYCGHHFTGSAFRSRSVSLTIKYPWLTLLVTQWSD